ncbi:Fur family transcriptional regulator [Jeotgalicoccus meleagridis]|jgi:Fur family zinc uptake transcriptional regulator|uniref:Ferric uptake regulation protein n=1 Tax=Jeotgalicoccus meleagridis TaxID=2759181 RepID=A0A6V7RKW7_9STAP|nr:Fur family transcriptional regulator [Jeotgalicoccus meleagridis]CAD2078156.1 Zinc-specific metallo-regulatory protein [Jeotgalicoccus meleagridis]HIW37403.1 transcriptional repressor [Candidatus Jeotgalicoccus stercoravium]
MHKELNDYKELLKEANFKVTKKRLRMIELFMQDERYLSAKEIQTMMSNEYPGISYDTIYRNLHTLNDINVLEKTSFGGEMQYKISCTDHHHHHFICERCGEIQVISYCPVAKWEEELSGVKINSHKIELYGLCENCA